MRKILLNKKRGKKSVNKTNFIPVEFNRDISLYHDEILSDTIDTMQVYNDEKDSSNKHRFIFTLYPLCTNVLFNKVTEVVYKEGSSEAVMLTNSTSSSLSSGATSTEKLNRIQAIRNTEYSNQKFNFTYHCGLDIFNNHLLRTNENITVQKKGLTVVNATVYDENAAQLSKSNFRSITTDAFNTIGDVNRTFNGDVVFTYLPNSSKDYTYEKSSKVRSPLYLYDTIKSFNNACKSGIKRKDGWAGFLNPSSLRIPINSANEYYVNRCINQKEGCEFIDMCPERDLFSFTPKKNSYRQRLEKNWDYCLTYPYKSVYEDDNKLILKGKKYGLPLTQINNDSTTNYRLYTASNNIELAMFYCPVKHNLKVGSMVNIKFIDTYTNKITQIRCQVVNLGRTDKKYNQRCFSIRYSDISNFVNKFGNPVGFARVINGYEVEYYFRKFKRIDINKHHDINKLAFAQTIYGDDISQIVYTDDIDVSNYVDNRNRPLSELYFTVIKTNRGHEEWYSSKNTCNSDKIEYSHVFGKVTSGLDLPSYVSDKNIPTIRYQHNIDTEWVKNKNSSIDIQESSLSLESNVKLSDDEFYGDLVEFNPSTLTETVLEEIYHRFNTAQREVTNHSLYNTMYYDEIAADLYDANVIEKNLNGATSSYVPKIQTFKFNEHYANLSPEGYIYRPHYKIKIGEFDDYINEGVDTHMKVINVSLNVNHITFHTEYNYILSPGDMVTILTEDFEPYRFRVETCVIDDSINKYKCEATYIENENQNLDNIDITKFNEYLFFKHNLEVPEYAYMLPDSSGRHLWKNIQKPSEWKYTDELYNTTFTNGAFYHHTNITFPVKRQDPFHEYNMVVLKDGIAINNNFEIPSTEYDYSLDEYVVTDMITCF